jgi:hypothetical protein
LVLSGSSSIAAERVRVVFDGGRLTSDAGVLLLADVERRLRLAELLARCIEDPRVPERVHHTVADGGEIHPCRNSLATLHSPATRNARPRLALRRLGHPLWRIAAIVEVYPALWSRRFPPEGRTPDQHDAYSTAAWMAQADRNSDLATSLKPDLTAEERSVAKIEGWILGVSGRKREPASARKLDRPRPERKPPSVPYTTKPGYVNRNR